MKKIMILSSVIVLLTSFKTNISLNTNNLNKTTTIINTVTKDWAYYAKKIKNLKPKGINVLNIDTKEDVSKLNISTSWEPFDYTLNGCKIIVVNADGYKEAKALEALKTYNLEKFKARKINQFGDKATLSNFKEYKLATNTCYYTTFQTKNTTNTDGTSISYEFIDAKAAVLISGFLFVKHPNADIKSTEATLKKIIDYLNN